MSGKILMPKLCESFEPVVEGMIIPVPANRTLNDFRDSQHGWYCYVQHDHFLDSPTHGKLLMRDTRYGGALKAFIRNFDGNTMPTGLEVIKLSQSGKSLIVKPVY